MIDMLHRVNPPPASNQRWVVSGVYPIGGKGFTVLHVYDEVASIELDDGDIRLLPLEEFQDQGAICTEAYGVELPRTRQGRPVRYLFGTIEVDDLMIQDLGGATIELLDKDGIWIPYEASDMQEFYDAARWWHPKKIKAAPQSLLEPEPVQLDTKFLTEAVRQAVYEVMDDYDFERSESELEKMFKYFFKRLREMTDQRELQELLGSVHAEVGSEIINRRSLDNLVEFLVRGTRPRPKVTTISVGQDGCVHLNWSTTYRGEHDLVVCRFTPHKGMVDATVIEPGRKQEYRGTTHYGGVDEYLERMFERQRQEEAAKTATKIIRTVEEANKKAAYSKLVIGPGLVHNPAEPEGDPMTKDKLDFGPAVNKFLDQVGPSLGHDENEKGE